MSAPGQNPQRPTWMDDEFLKICIKNDKGTPLEKVSIEDVKLSYVVPKGENFTSVILRVIVRGHFNKIDDKHEGDVKNGHAIEQNGQDKSDEVKYIVKVVHDSDILKDHIQHFVTFDKEVKMYFKFIPAFQNLLLQSGVSTDFACRGIHIREANEVIVLEDLGVLGYTLSDRMKGNDWDHSKLVITKMALLHAASMRYFQINTVKFPDIYYNSLIHENENDELNGRAAYAFKSNLMKEALMQKSGYEHEVDILFRIKDIAYDLISDDWKYKKGNIFNTLLHGDMWINNIMFKYDVNGKPTDVRLIDLQCSYYNSTAVEFLYYFLSSVNDDVRKNNFNDSVELYHETFVSTLEKVGYEGSKPTLDQWKQEIKDRANLFFFSCGGMLSFLKESRKKQNEDRSEHETLTEEEIKKMLENKELKPEYIESLAISIDILKEIGVFERLEKIVNDVNREIQAN